MFFFTSCLHYLLVLILENKIYFSTDAKFDIEIEKIISQILHYENIIIEVVGSKLATIVFDGSVY